MRSSRAAGGFLDETQCRSRTRPARGAYPRCPARRPVPASLRGGGFVRADEPAEVHSERGGAVQPACSGIPQILMIKSPPWLHWKILVKTGRKNPLLLSCPPIPLESSDNPYSLKQGFDKCQKSLEEEEWGLGKGRRKFFQKFLLPSPVLPLQQPPSTPCRARCRP